MILSVDRVCSRTEAFYGKTSIQQQRAYGIKLMLASIVFFIFFVSSVLAATYPDAPRDSRDQRFVNEYLEWHRRAEKGDAYAQYRLGYAYLVRCDNPINTYRGSTTIVVICADDDRYIKEAIKWLRWSADKDTHQAIVLLARLNYHGWRDTYPAAKPGGFKLEPDKEKSLEYFVRALDLGIANAGWSAAKILFEQKQEPARAIALLQEASLRGSILAQFELATYYENGDHVAQDFAEAYRWYEISRLNHEINDLSVVREADRLRALEQSMSAMEIEKVRLLIEETPTSAVAQMDDPFYGAIGSHIDWKRR